MYCQKTAHQRIPYGLNSGIHNFYFMQKQVKLQAKETAATNRDFYNLFRPIAPGIDVIGKVAQVISGLTEAVTIWHITQSEMAGSSKFLSISISIVAMILVVALLELGGRKFLQVLTRALVWKRLQNAWYIGLFIIVSGITIGMGVLSFRMSTNGINYAFMSNVPVGMTFDNQRLETSYQTRIQSINEQANQELALLRENHQGVLASTEAQYNARILALRGKVKSYEQKLAAGHKWAGSQANKYRKQANSLITESAEKQSKQQRAYGKQLDTWKQHKAAAIDREEQRLEAAVNKGERAMLARHDAKRKDASFWGNLFSFFVGFSVILAFICIISVEVYRRGAGIEVAYEELEKADSIPLLFWQGMTGRVDNFFRRKAERFAQIPNSTPDRSSRIGFDYPSGLPVAETEQEY